SGPSVPPGRFDDGDSAEPLEGLRRYVRLETERLRMRHRLGLGGSEIATARSYQVDLVVQRACRAAAESAGPGAQPELSACAVVALGGYGRAELAPYSDVDLLFLRPERSSTAVTAFVERALQLLWDAGLAVGHSFRSPAECVEEARADLHSRTALTEARLVGGSTALFDSLLHALDEGLLRNQKATDRFLEALRLETDERHESQGSAVCVQEPNVKEGVGGLRDLHTVLWAGHARFGSGRLSTLLAEGWVSAAEYRTARRASDFLWRVRNEAHFSTGRRTDFLSLDLQGELGPRLGYRAKGGLLDSELFMRDYYRRASELHELCRGFLMRHGGARPRRLFPALRRPRRTRRGFEVRDGRLFARESAGEFPKNALALLEAVEVAQLEGVAPSEPLKAQLRTHSNLVNRAFRSSPEARGALLRMLGRRGHVGPALRTLHETGILGRLLPEWARISLLVQHDLYHRYTVDEHTLRAFEALDEVAAGEKPELSRLGSVLDEIEDVTPLYVGMLLHDIGKGRGGGHVEKGVRIATRTLAHLGLDPEATAKVLFLVEAHLEMSQLSQQRDLSEPALIEAFAKRVGSLERLTLLLLLTYADHRAVGPGIWTDWKGTLLWELYDRTRHRLMGGEAHGDRADAERETAVTSLRQEFPLETVEHHFALLPERYLRATDAERMGRHFRLLCSRGERPVSVDWHDLERGRATELTVTARDRRGLFAAVSGTLTANNIDILSVDLLTRADGIVLDSLRVSELPDHEPVSPERKARIEAALAKAVSGETDVPTTVERWRRSQRRRPRRHWGRIQRRPTVRFDNDGSATATIVEVRAPDQPGLAFTISGALADLGLDITFAKIATAKALALDVFYVTDAAGMKLVPEVLGEVEATLLGALGARPEQEAAKEAR
ncbi:MAG: [protein-PII] uridylyltransferase, partial [Acidobacteria bacterium]|nr:[protein-PII] uridylyltransferase [Acidobacteriota bacterium]